HAELLNLSGDCHWKLCSETDVMRNLVCRDLTTAIIANLIGCRMLSLAKPDPGANLFAVLSIGHANHLYVDDLRVCVQKFFDLPRINVFAAANDHVFETPHDVDVTILAHNRKIACMHPAGGVD